MHLSYCTSRKMDKAPPPPSNPLEAQADEERPFTAHDF
jgi:hypothetical protein